ncbi:MAG: hypothetical protein JWO69_1184, partial [Thermoleophilia bacterium]|nr:hypothetical protein [Thermoleophilia bacterium]
MPNLDGPGLVHAARARNAVLPVVVCSAIDLDDSATGLAGQADGIVQKPFVPADLVRTIVEAYNRPRPRDTAAAS